MSKTDIATAHRELKSPNIKTRSRALKTLKDAKKRGK
ncbi:putative metal homeostasis protein [Lacticaseibacillus kribbianus]|nr:putative metal homeostasis protein [Lacticaseibacillus kribbianus]